MFQRSRSRNSITYVSYRIARGVTPRVTTSRHVKSHHAARRRDIARHLSRSLLVILTGVLERVRA